MEYWLAWFHEGNRQVKEVAMAAEQLGFAGIAIPDHIAIPTTFTSVHPSGERLEHRGDGAARAGVEWPWPPHGGDDRDHARFLRRRRCRP